MQPNWSQTFDWWSISIAMQRCPFNGVRGHRSPNWNHRQAHASAKREKKKKKQTQAADLHVTGHSPDWPALTSGMERRGGGGSTPFHGHPLNTPADNSKWVMRYPQTTPGRSIQPRGGKAWHGMTGGWWWVVPVGVGACGGGRRGHSAGEKTHEGPADVTARQRAVSWRCSSLTLDARTHRATIESK